MWNDAAVKNLTRKFASGILFAVSALALSAATSAVAHAQNAPATPPPPPPGDVIYFERIGHGGMPPDAIEFVEFQAGLDDKVVTGAPFSATISTQTTQTLADGNTIQHTSTGSLARDGQGRTRRDMTLPAIGPWADSGKPAPHVVSVNDPVANARYLLDADTKVARIMQVPQGQWTGKEHHEHAFARAAEENETVTTSLGTQMVGGVSAEGTRYTRTIPAGQIGNTKPIVIISERWYSPDLQMFVMTKHTDPRMGESTFQMTNIQRQEPAATLFEVPADYTVKQGGERGARRAGPAMPTPPLEQ
jgi:hypothetical protein